MGVIFIWTSARVACVSTDVEIIVVRRGACRPIRLLTDAEPADGGRWAHHPDPFGAWHADPCEDTGGVDPGAPLTRREEP